MSGPIVTTTITLSTEDWDELSGVENLVDNCSGAVSARKDGKVRVIVEGFYDTAEAIIERTEDCPSVKIDFDSNPKNIEVAKNAPFSYDPHQDFKTRPGE